MAKSAKWEKAIERRANSQLFAAAWRRGQKLRQYIELLVEGFFDELVTIGVDVEGAPSLGVFTPNWEPLSESWSARKGHDQFYFDTGALERTLLRKSTAATFGRPQVYLESGGRKYKINAGVPAAKYDGQKLSSLTIRVVAFPKLDKFGDAEELVAGGNANVFYKLTGPKGTFQRPLVSPFVNWYLHDKIRKAMRSLR